MSKHKQNELSCDLVRERFDYDPATGLFTYSGRERAHLPPSARSKRVGRQAGWIDTSGHINVKIGGTGYLVHRVIWLHVTGEWPDGVVDHRNGIKTDNRWSNLRLVSQAINMQNLHGGYTGSSSGVLGVSPGITPGTWMANIRVKQVPIRLGTFSSTEEAYAAYLNAKALVHPESSLAGGRFVDYFAFTATARKNLQKAGYWPQKLSQAAS